MKHNINIDKFKNKIKIAYRYYMIVKASPSMYNIFLEKSNLLKIIKMNINNVKTSKRYEKVIIKHYHSMLRSLWNIL